MGGGIEEMHREEEEAWLEKEANLKGLHWDKLAKEVGQWGETLSLVKRDLQDRETLGLKKYGVALNHKTRDDMLQHLYEELLDAAMYIRTLIEQRKKNGI